jgi:hypothetical protein
MKVKVFVLTWQDEKALTNNLNSLFSHPRLDNVDLNVTVINNHPNFWLNESFHGYVYVMHNNAVPEFATAHVSRMWNTALIHGFKDLDNPDADIVITSQDDTIWNDSWLSDLIEIHKDYSFYASTDGDMVCSYTVDAVKNIGLWDERFGYGFGEGDYFLRALKYNADKSTINDHAHGRIWNPTKVISSRPEPDGKRYDEQNRSHNFRGLSWKTFLMKWQRFEMEGKWPSDIKQKVDEMPIANQYILYPYFELKVNNLSQKGYITP